MFNFTNIKELEEIIKINDIKTQASIKNTNIRINMIEDEIKNIYEKLKEHKKAIDEIYNVFNKINEYNNKHDYVVTDLKENMNNSFKDIEKAKKFIEKLRQKNIPYKLNNKLHKHLMRGK